MNPQAPKLYGLPKLHKPSLCFRPIVSLNSSPTEKLCKRVNKIITNELNFEATYSIKNTSDLIAKIKDISIPENSILVSFDVVNLFSSIPVEELLPLVKTMFDKTPESKSCYFEGVFNLIELCVRNNYVQFNNAFYESTGLGMGSPLRPISAEIFTNFLENNYIGSVENPFKGDIGYWYVDDIICLFEGSKLELWGFFNYLNSINHNIKFTIQTEKND